MKHPEIHCQSCGSTRLKRSHSMSLLELPKMAFGSYPFRCLDCRARSWINVWSLARRKIAFCPRCLNSGLVPIEPERMRLSLWGMLRMAMGARPYRCTFCNARFLSSKPSVRESESPREEQASEKAAHQPEMSAAAIVSD